MFKLLLQATCLQNNERIIYYSALSGTESADFFGLYSLPASKIFIHYDFIINYADSFLFV